MQLPFFFLNKNLVHGASQHPEAFGVSDGLQEPFLQLLLGRVLRQQQGVEAGVRGRQPGRNTKWDWTLEMRGKRHLR